MNDNSKNIVHNVRILIIVNICYFERGLHSQYQKKYFLLYTNYINVHDINR